MTWGTSMSIMKDELHHIGEGFASSGEVGGGCANDNDLFTTGDYCCTRSFTQARLNVLICALRLQENSNIQK